MQKNIFLLNIYNYKDKKCKYISNVKLYKGDCLVNLENIKDNSIDLIVTDPPYLIDTVGGQGSVNSILKLDKSLNDLKKNQDITNGYNVTKL